MDRETLYEAFKIAINREREAREFYRGIAADAAEPEVRELFGKFAAEESGHLSQLEDLYARLREES